MNINVKFCKKCDKAYDFPECPYCREEERKKIPEIVTADKFHKLNNMGGKKT